MLSSLTEIKGADLNFKAKNEALLIMKVYEVAPLKCEQCGEAMKIIAYITNATSIHRILSHIGESGKKVNESREFSRIGVNTAPVNDHGKDSVKIRVKMWQKILAHQHPRQKNVQNRRERSTREQI